MSIPMYLAFIYLIMYIKSSFFSYLSSVWLCRCFHGTHFWVVLVIAQSASYLYPHD